MVQNQDEKSVWKNETSAHAGDALGARKQATAAQGTAKDAYRVLDRHQKEVQRTNNRKMVSSYTGTTDKTNKTMFNAVSSLDGTPKQNSGPTFGERAAHASWHSTRKGGYPYSRAKQRKDKLAIAAFAIIFIAIIVFLVLIVRSCAG